MKNKINNSMISNKRVYISIAIVLLVIFIIGIIALGVFKIGRGGDTPTPTYYSYKIDGKNMPSSAEKDDDFTFTLKTNINYHESVMFHSENNLDVDRSGHYLVGGVGLSFTLSIEEESYYLKAASVEEIIVEDYDWVHGQTVETHSLPSSEYSGEYNSETKSYKVTITHENRHEEDPDHARPFFLYSIALKYSVIKK